MTIKTDFGPFEELVTQAIVREVPLYQRRYSWGKKEIGELWDDIRRLYLLRSKGMPQTHFVGSVILGEPKWRGALQPALTPIIDGQQRLMTLSILIAVMCDVLVDKGSVDTVVEKYLVHKGAGKSREPRISAGRWDVGAYREVLNRLPFSDTDSKVRPAYENLLAVLQAGPNDNDQLEVDEDQSEETDVARENLQDWNWETLLTVLTQDLEFAVVSNVPENRAYEIFQTLNSLGTPLSQVDLARNALFVTLPRQAESLYNKLWLPMENALTPDVFEDYLHCWVTANGQSVSSKGAFNGFLELLKVPGADSSHSVGVLENLFKGAGEYLLIVAPSDAERRKPFMKQKVDKALVEALLRLREWGTRPLEPALFLIASRVIDGHIDAAAAIRMLKAIESLLIRRYICHIPPNDLRSIFVRITHVLADCEPQAMEAVLRSELLEPSRRWPTDREVVQQGVELDFYRSKPKQSFFILTSLARAMQGKETPAMALGTGANDWSIEHVLPQKLSASWKTQLQKWGCGDPTDLHQRKLHVIGNLTVTIYNADLSNKTLAEKQTRLKELNHQLRLSDEILKAAKWNEAAIDARSRSLLTKATKVWPRS